MNVASWTSSYSKTRSRCSTSPGTSSSQSSTSPESTSSLVKVLIDKPPPFLTSLVPVNFAVGMAEERRTIRNKPRISYEISSDSDDLNLSSSDETLFSNSKKRQKGRPTVVDLGDETDDTVEEIESPQTPPPRTSSAGHSLRQRNKIKRPLRVLENGDRRTTTKQKKNNRSKARATAKPNHPPTKVTLTERTEVRHLISTVTAGKRANFFVANKHFFLPLLPKSNHIQRLIEERQGSPQYDKDLSIPYQHIQKQPAGYLFFTAPYCVTSADQL